MPGWKAVLVIWAVLGLSAPIGAAPEGTDQPIALKRCNVAIPPLAGMQLAEQTTDSVLLRGQFQGSLFTAALFCSANDDRTYKPEPILGKPGVEKIKDLYLEGEIRGVLFYNARYAGSRKLDSIEAYFATRNLNYRLIVLRENGPLGENRKRASDLAESILARLNWIVPPESTISEEEYRQRLILLGGGGLALVILLAFAFMRRKKNS